MTATYIARRLREEIERQREARKGTMQAGMPRTCVYESDLIYAVNLLEALAEAEQEIRKSNG